jgi:hypothetical protein
VLVMDPTVVARVNSLWCELGLPQSGPKGKTTP